MADEKRTIDPHDRLTRLCAVMTDALDADPEMTDDVNAIVFLQDGDRGGIQLHGYDDDVEAMVDLLWHVRAIFRANGKDLHLVPMGTTPDDAESN
jgi:hypothetical protein